MSIKFNTNILEVAAGIDRVLGKVMMDLRFPGNIIGYCTSVPIRKYDF